MEAGTDAAAASGRDDGYARLGYNECVTGVFSSLQESQMELSHMADSKANIMITVSSILLSLVIAKIEQGTLVLPGTLFAVFCAPALIFAILCVMPSSPRPGRVTGNGVLPQGFNLLFFTHFTRLSPGRFESEVERVMTDPDTFYRNLTQDIYQAGMVLRTKKYRYLRWSYLSLVAGIITGSSALLYELLLRA